MEKKRIKQNYPNWASTSFSAQLLLLLRGPLLAPHTYVSGKWGRNVSFALYGILAVAELATDLGAIDRNPHLGFDPGHYKNLISSLSSSISRAPPTTPPSVPSSRAALSPIRQGQPPLELPGYRRRGSICGSRDP
jgi:hypothetical protein